MYLENEGYTHVSSAAPIEKFSKYLIWALYRVLNFAAHLQPTPEHHYLTRLEPGDSLPR